MARATKNTKKGARMIAAPERGAARQRTRDTVRYLDLPAELAGRGHMDKPITRMKVEVFAKPEGTVAVEDGYDGVKRGVYLTIRGDCDGTHNMYGVFDSRRRQVAVIRHVPEAPTAWDAQNDRGEIHEAVRDTVLYEAWKILAGGDGETIPDDEKAQRPCTRLVYRGFFPYPGVRVDIDGSLFRTGNQMSRRIDVVRDPEGEDVKVTLEQVVGRSNEIELTIGSGESYTYSKPALRHDSDAIYDAYAVFGVRTITALEKLKDALAAAIIRAKEDRWPYQS